MHDVWSRVLMTYKETVEKNPPQASFVITSWNLHVLKTQQTSKRLKFVHY
jgi:hypothetical protein